MHVRENGAGIRASRNRNGYPWRAWAVAGLAAVSCGCSEWRLGGLAAWDPGIEMHWYTPINGVTPLDATESQVQKKTSNFGVGAWGRLSSKVALNASNLTRDAATSAVRNGNFTVMTLMPGEYEFRYDLPEDRGPLYGEIKVHAPASLRARDFLHRGIVMVNPTSGLGGDNAGVPSILTDDDIARVRGGDMVTKVVFVADLQAVDGRIEMIERDLRRIRDLNARLNNQLAYWNAKLEERRRNALFGGEMGEDIPGIGLASLQLLLGPESYHWLRYSEAEDMVRSYEAQMVELALPIQRLRQERTALRNLLGAVRVLHRSGDMILATPAMIRDYHDALHEVQQGRHTLGVPGFPHRAPLFEGPFSNSPHHVLTAPYRLSSSTKSITYPRTLPNTIGVSESKQSIGEVVMVMRVGPRPVGRFN